VGGNEHGLGMSANQPACAARVAITGALLMGSMFLAARFGLVTLIARGYRALAYVLLVVFVLPVLTLGLRRLWRTRNSSFA
jgi:uncharacterized membrane protein YkvI